MTATTVALRADASAAIGRGHMARCWAVASSLRSRQIDVLLLTHDLPMDLRDSFAAIGCGVVDLDDPVDPWSVHRVLEAAGVTGPTTSLLVDHYGLDAAWESEVRPAVGRIATIEDRPFRRHEVDLLIDAGGGADRLQRYAEFLPESAQVVNGHDHAIVDPIYARLHDRLPALDGEVQRVLVQMGSDRSELVVQVLRALENLERPSLVVDVVLPGDHPCLPDVRELAATAGWRVHSDVARIWHLYARVDLAVAAPGVAMWERCSMGVPSVAIETTPMHAGAYDDLGPSPAVTRLGPAAQLGPHTLEAALGSELSRADLRRRSQACRRLIDGRGAHRVASLLTVGPESTFRLRDVRPGDEARLLRWANDRHTRAWSFSDEAITPEEHHRWLTARLRAIEEHHLYLLEDHWGSEIGLARFVRTPDGWEMSATLAPGYRSRGLAEVIVDLPRRRLVEDEGTPCSIIATVLTVRPGAGQVLSRLGFEVVSRDEQARSMTLRWTAA